MSTKEIFSDILILRRQVHTGSRRDIPDMIGVDRDSNIVIIENKNVPVTEEIVSQISRYAVWGKASPDAIKAMWLEAKNRPEDAVPPDWDNLEIRVMVLAPSIKQSVPRLLKILNCRVDLIEVRRFSVGHEELLLLNRLEEEPEAKTKSAHGMEVYDKEYYNEHNNPKSVDIFFKVVDEVEALVRRKGWNLEKKFNKNYMGFKTGFPNVFGIQWLGTRSFGFFFKVPHSQFLKVRRLSPYKLEYDERWKQATLKYDKGINVRKLEPFFVKIYDLFMEK
jgi:hypothetical protein